MILEPLTQEELEENFTQEELNILATIKAEKEEALIPLRNHCGIENPNNEDCERIMGYGRNEYCPAGKIAYKLILLNCKVDAIRAEIDKYIENQNSVEESE